VGAAAFSLLLDPEGECSRLIHLILTRQADRPQGGGYLDSLEGRALHAAHRRFAIYISREHMHSADAAGHTRRHILVRLMA
jgi:hypothetical protein